MASTSAISPAWGWRTEPGGTSKRAEGGAGTAGGQAGERRGAGILFGAGAAAGLAPALLSAGSGFFRERLPWVTRLRGDTTLPSPSGNLSIREIDNPQRRAVHPLSSPDSGARRPKVAPLACEGGYVGVSPHRDLVACSRWGRRKFQKNGLGTCLGLFPSLRPYWASSKPGATTGSGPVGREAPSGGQGKTVESRNWFISFVSHQGQRCYFSFAGYDVPFLVFVLKCGPDAGPQKMQARGNPVLGVCLIWGRGGLGH